MDIFLMKFTIPFNLRKNKKVVSIMKRPFLFFKLPAKTYKLFIAFKSSKATCNLAIRDSSPLRNQTRGS